MRFFSPFVLGRLVHRQTHTRTGTHTYSQYVFVTMNVRIRRRIAVLSFIAVTNTKLPNWEHCAIIAREKEATHTLTQAI